MMRVCIDAGHGGHDSGAVAPDGTKEKDVVLRYSHELGRHFDSAGHEVLLTRRNNTFLALSDRARLANEWGADIFLSVHANAASAAAANGAWVIYDDRSKPNRGPALARAIFDELRQIPGIEDADADREVFADGTAWVGHRQLTVISKTACPAVLIELGFLTNPDDLRELKSESLQKNVCAAIVSGAVNWAKAFGVIDLDLPAPAVDDGSVEHIPILDLAPVDVLKLPARAVASSSETTGEMVERVLRHVRNRPEAAGILGWIGRWALGIVLEKLRSIFGLDTV